MIDPRNGFNAPDCSNEQLISLSAGTAAGAASSSGRDNARPLQDAPPRAPRFADIEEPLEALLIWAFALLDAAPKGLCKLLGVRDFDESALSERQRTQLEELRATRAAEEIFSRDELGRLLRSQFGLQIGRCNNARDFDRLSRAAQRMPVWVFDAQLAAAEDAARTARATQVRMEAELAREECKTRKLELKARAAVAKEAIAEPRLFSSTAVKLVYGSDAVFKHGMECGRLQLLADQEADAQEREHEGQDSADFPAEGSEDFESLVEQTRSLLSLIDSEQKYNRIRSEVTAGAREITNWHVSEIERRMREE